MNYEVEIRSRLGMRSEIQDRSHCESIRTFEGILDAVEYIERKAITDGWRDFTLRTIGEDLEKPLRGKDASVS